MTENESFEIVDTTLRDGEQSAGVVFSIEERMNIISALDKANVKWIEAGIPAMGKQECEALSLMLELPIKSNLIAWNRANLKDLKASIDCGFKFVHVSLPVSDLHIEYKLQKSRVWVLDQLKTCLEYLKNCGITIIVGAEDASRADPEFFLQYADIAASYGAIRIRYSDTVGCLDHFTTYNKIESIVNRSPLPVEIHAHNDFGLALANTLAAYRAGAKFASVTITGIGERAGNASMEETAVSLKHFYNYDCGIELEALTSLVEMVSKASERTLFPYKPVVGPFTQKILDN
ncbi:homocitrate synthase [Methanosarcina sp. T3]|uniref:homocitrate synthase n=1 Tax=Methanosarcina sp. T3 TaxID=3439062 RepID=UPI003F83D50A